MQLSDFDYDLPDELIAHYPLPSRTSSRLLVLNGSNCQDLYFNNLLGLLNPNDLLIYNDTKVIPARMMGEKQTGGKVEVLLERVLSEQTALCHVRSNKKLKEGTILVLEGSVDAKVHAKENGLYVLEFLGNCSVIEQISQYGHMPLPPYIRRQDGIDDQTRYQTVYARHLGAVAAPTAGLHFDVDLLEKIKSKGIDSAAVTLHVGAGTFQPVRVENLAEHRMHQEYCSVSEEVCDAVKQCRANGGRVIAVGTTTARSLETAALKADGLKVFHGETDLFITPGFKFKVIDGLITNFHLPRSTLLMMVSAFAGVQSIKQAYQHAIEQRYRFFSYGDAMLLLPDSSSC